MKTILVRLALGKALLRKQRYSRVIKSAYIAIIAPEEDVSIVALYCILTLRGFP